MFAGDYNDLRRPARPAAGNVNNGCGLNMFGRETKVERTITIVNKLGIHDRPASLFEQTASRFGSEIQVKKDKQVIDGKSILGLLMLAAGQGTALTVSAKGPDAVEALDAIERLIGGKFGEE